MATAEKIKQGFICPECLKEFRTQELLLSHFEEHTKQKSLKDVSTDFLSKISAELVGITKKKTTETVLDTISDKFGIQESTPVPPGVTRSYIDEFKRIRRERLDHRISEANMLIIRLDRLLRCDESDRKQAAEELVMWIDGKNVSRCPNCTVRFNIARRQHHCRLCGVIMCSSCSAFLTYKQARIIVGPFDVTNSSFAKQENTEADLESIRLCLYCFDILESRKNLQISQHMKPPICELYNKLQSLKSDIQTSVDLYHEMHSSLIAGDTIHFLQDAQSLHENIAKKAEIIDITSKKVSILPAVPADPLTVSLHNAVRRSTFQYIKDNLATLPALPTPKEIERIKSAKLSTVYEQPRTVPKVKKVVVTTGWSPANSAAANKAGTDDDPLIEQIKIVREYIKQAREAQRFEEVASLNENLRVLQRQYQLQRQIENN